LSERFFRVELGFAMITIVNYTTIELDRSSNTFIL